MTKRNVLKASLTIIYLGTSACSVVQHSESGSEQKIHSPYRQEDWVQIPVGEFLMGSPDSDTEASANEKPQHLVKIMRPFKMSRYEITFEQYEAFAKATNRAMPSDSGFNEGAHERLPVINVSWDDANAYAEWLSKETDKHFRLPTEAEWEYAARAGTTSTRFWGDNPADACDFANVFDKRNEAKIRDRFSVPKGIAANHNCEDAYFATAPVGSFKSNPWGLYDMLGNVWEWVQDCSHDNYNGAPTVASPAWQTTDEAGCTKHGVRGGSWFVSPGYVRSAERSWDHPEVGGTGLGFRLLQE